MIPDLVEITVGQMAIVFSLCFALAVICDVVLLWYFKKREKRERGFLKGGKK